MFFVRKDHPHPHPDGSESFGCSSFLDGPIAVSFLPRRSGAVVSWYMLDTKTIPHLLSLFLYVLVLLCFSNFLCTSDFSLIFSGLEKPPLFLLSLQVGNALLLNKLFVDFFQDGSGPLAPQKFDFRTAANCGRRRLSGGGNYASYEVALSCVSRLLLSVGLSFRKLDQMLEDPGSSSAKQELCVFLVIY